MIMREHDARIEWAIARKSVFWSKIELKGRISPKSFEVFPWETEAENTDLTDEDVKRLKERLKEF